MDVDIRMQEANSTKKALLDYIPTQVREWHEEEIQHLYAVLEVYDREIKLQGYNLNFPDTIFFIKTTLDEEFKGASAYTRSNAVIFNGDKILEADAQLDHLVMHELFHIISRHDRDLRRKVYNIIGFEMMEEVQLTEKLKNFKLSNPDAPYNDSYINLDFEGQPIECMMLLYADRTFTGGGLFDYVNIGLVRLKGEDEKQIDLVDGEPVIYTIQEVKNFFEQVGSNTKYIIDPEEIIADNFAFTMNGKQDLPNPEIIIEIQRILKE